MFFCRQVFHVRWWCWSLFIGKFYSIGLGEGGLSTSQAWDRHQKEWLWVLLWGVGFVPALILISTVSDNEIVFILCFGVLRDLSPSVLSSLSYDFSFHSLLSNLPTASVMSHLKTSNTFLKPASFPCCHCVSLLPLEAKPQKSIITSSCWHSSHCSDSDNLLVTTLNVFSQGFERFLLGKIQWIL